MRIIYPKDTGVAVVIPSPNWKGTIEELAAKDISFRRLLTPE